MAYPGGASLTQCKRTSRVAIDKPLANCTMPFSHSVLFQWKSDADRSLIQEYVPFRGHVMFQKV
jgi:hypothetical protein